MQSSTFSDLQRSGTQKKTSRKQSGTSTERSADLRKSRETHLYIAQYMQMTFQPLDLVILQQLDLKRKVHIHAQCDII